ncbi:MAG: zinc-dependent metalloprotease [Roseobacter sp.]|jgi:hypothetical protein|nr:zinc-dependent metalloprotease [Roseobacter sp.]
MKLTLIALGFSALLNFGAHAQEVSDFDEIIDGADVSEGPVTLYQKDGSLYFSLSPQLLDRTLIWSAEVARYPSDAISIQGTEIATRAVSLERRGDRLLVRSLSSGAIRTSNASRPRLTTTPLSPASTNLKMRPIDIAVSNVQIGPVLLALDIVAEKEDGQLLVDGSAAFTSDIPDYSVKGQLASTGLVPIAIDPSRSFIANAAAYPTNVFIASHLTFMAQDQAGTDRAVSVEVAHSIILLPEDPMERRLFDPRVGYFATEVLEFEGPDGAPAERLQLALRHRLVHADPSAPLPSDPVEPLVYYLSPEIPERWRPYIRDAIEDWQPAFEAAGFTNAIVARDAPTKDEDPNWSVNDARHNVIRWIAQPIANALGPNVHDPRTGEIISAHILVWPDVLNVFSDYYYLLMSDLDDRAKSLPLPEELQGRILRYAVSHEVGHTLGLRHNHRASTAWRIDQLRDPAFAAENGSTASIMAYGRFNYVARPEDGVEQFFPLIGAYDEHAIAWGYMPRLTEDALDRLASGAYERPELAWAAGETPAETLGRFDPTILIENIGSDRIAATRAAVDALRASIESLPDAFVSSPFLENQIVRVYDQGRDRYLGFMDGVNQMVGGLTSTAADGTETGFVSVNDQKSALHYLMSDAIRDLDIFADPSLLQRIRPVGGIEAVDDMAEAIVSAALDPLVIRRVHTQNILEPEREFGVAEMLATATDAVIQDPVPITDMDPPRRAALSQYVTLLQELPTYSGDPSADILELMGFPLGIVSVAHADLSDTGIADATQAELQRLVEAFSPEEDGFATRLFKDIEQMIGIEVEDASATNGDSE